MQVTVYRMRERGERIDARNPALRHGVKGWLVFVHVSDDYGRRTVARLVREKGSREDVIQPLLQAQIRRIDGVIHLAGIEQVGFDGRHDRGGRFRQSWLCSTDEAAAASVLDRVTYRSENEYEDYEDYEDDFKHPDWEPPK